MQSDTAYTKTTLGSGVRLILVPMQGVNSVATSVMVAVGSRYETKKINGISHFLEHMVFKGTKKYPTMNDVNIIERIGGLQNAYTDIDITNYHNKVLSTDWELALEVNKELVLAPKIEEKFIDKERDVIIEEMKRYEDEPEVKVEETLHQMMYPSQSLGMRIIGEPASLLATKGETLRGYHDIWYTPERMVVVVTGRIKNQESEIRGKTQEWFGLFHDSRFIIHDSIETVTDTQDKPRLVVVTKPDASQAHMMLGFRTFRRGSDDRFAWNLFNLLMGVSFTSRLFKEIREKRGLCYHIRSSSNNWADVGNWSIYAGVATEKVGEALQAILAELAKAAEYGIKEDEVRVAKKRLKTMLAFKSEDPEFMTEFYGRQELFGEPIMTLDEYVRRIEKIEKEEINRLVKKYLISRTLNMALVWNKGKVDNFLDKLRL